jgi:localization factor PodJL
MHNLAVLYAEGGEGKPDYANAVKWFTKAADYGVGDSQFNLGVLNARGIGIEQNLAESYKWFSLAAQGGDRDASQKRDEIGKRLDAKTLAQVQASIRNWKPQVQPPEAVSVSAPQGGWTQASATPAPAAPAPARAKPAAKPKAPAKQSAVSTSRTM